MIEFKKIKFLALGFLVTLPLSVMAQEADSYCPQSIICQGQGSGTTCNVPTGWVLAIIVGTPQDSSTELPFTNAQTYLGVYGIFASVCNYSVTYPNNSFYTIALYSYIYFSNMAADTPSKWLRGDQMNYCWAPDSRDTTPNDPLIVLSPK